MRQVETTNRFLNDLPSGITLLNVIGDRYYFFNKKPGGYINDGMFYSHLDTWLLREFDFVYDRKTSETFKLTKDDKEYYKKLYHDWITH